MQCGDGLLGANPKEAITKTAAEEGKHEEAQKEIQAKLTPVGDENQDLVSKVVGSETDQLE